MKSITSILRVVPGGRTDERQATLFPPSPEDVEVVQNGLEETSLQLGKLVFHLSAMLLKAGFESRSKERTVMVVLT